MLLSPPHLRLFLLPRSHLPLLLFQQLSRDAKGVRLGGEEEVPEGGHEGGGFGLEETGEEDLKVFGVDDLCVGGCEMGRSEKR